MKLRPAPVLDAFEKTKAELDAKLVAMGPGSILLGYQQRALQAASTYALLVIEKSRRIGLTWGLAFLAVLTAAKKRGAGGTNAWYMGFEKDMTKEFIDACAMWAKAMNFAIEELGEVVIEDEKDIKAFVINFPSGFKISALPAVARAWRGKQGLVFIDEAAFISDLEEVLKAALALTMWGGRVIVVSTHNGTDNPFNKLIEEIQAEKRGGDVMKITLANAMADGLWERIKFLQPATPAKDVWERDLRARYGENASEELDCIPKAGGGSWIKAEDISACEHPDAGRPELYQGGLCYIGRDIARRRDWAVIWVFELVGAVLWLRERYEEVGASFADQDAAFEAMTKKYRVVEATFDETGMGMPVVEAAVLKYGQRVKGLMFTPTSKLSIATLLRERFEGGLIKIPPDPAVRVDLRGIKRASNDNKALAETKEVHPDRFWAAALACLSAAGIKVDYAYTAVSTLKPGNDDDAFSRRWGEQPAAGGQTEHGLRRGGTW